MLTVQNPIAPAETVVKSSDPCRILIIDDDDQFRGVLCEVLRKMGYQVEAVGNGMEALEVLESLQNRLPDVILSDVWMQEIDGYHLLSVLRKNRKADEIPFIFMTGRDGSQGMRRGMELGADDYLFKPFTKEQLQSTIQARLKRRKAMQMEARSKLEDLRCSIRTSLPHEFITPLSGLLGLAEIISEEAPHLRLQEIRENAEQMEDLTLKLYRLVNNFYVHSQLELTFKDPKKIESLQRCRTDRPFPIISRQAQRIAERWNRERDLIVSLESGREEKSLALSEQYLSKALEELLDNAFKFSLPGSQVKMMVSQQAGGCLMTLTDEGRGMSPIQLRRIGAYVQFDRKIWEQPGAGLGLIIARRLLEIHDGYLSFESELNKGTTVEVFFPYSKESWE